ncbi:MAG TPA: PIG-L deacetylase family protein [Candidatus Saccharimonadales bacterium]|nr:PIG-L deacetylase family protein [Candidatus Saccharimonadales bacterium]
MDDYDQIFGDKKTVLVVTAHPDDLDAMCGGTVARLTADGKRVISIKTTTGNNGSRDSKISPAFLAKKRQTEDARAMKTLGLDPRDSVNLGFDDGSIENSKEVVERISYYIRKFQPQIIITLNPEKILISKQGKTWVNHRDHRNTAAATVDATYPFSRDLSFFAKQFDDPKIKPSKCNEILFADYCPGEKQVKIKIDDFTGQKQKALESHASQFNEEAVKDVMNIYSVKQSDSTFESFRHVSF